MVTYKDISPRIIEDMCGGAKVQDTYIDERGTHSVTKRWKFMKLDNHTYLRYVYFPKTRTFCVGIEEGAL